MLHFVTIKVISLVHIAPAMSNVLKHFNGDTFGKHPVVCRVMCGIYRKRPQLSRYLSTWDINLVFDLFRDWGENNYLHFRQLTLKLAVLMLLTSCQRVQTLSTFKILDLFWNNTRTTATFRLSELLKHSSFQQFDTDPILCVLRTLKCYLSRTKPMRHGQDKLMINWWYPQNQTGSQYSVQSHHCKMGQVGHEQCGGTSRGIQSAWHSWGHHLKIGKTSLAHQVLSCKKPLGMQRVHSGNSTKKRWLSTLTSPMKC